MDPLRGATKRVVDVNKHLLISGSVYLRQLYVVNSSEVNECKVEIHNAINTTEVDDLKFKTLIPKQINQGLAVAIVDSLTATHNAIIDALNSIDIAPIPQWGIPGINQIIVPGFTIPGIPGFTIDLGVLPTFRWGGWAGYTTSDPLWASADPFWGGWTSADPFWGGYDPFDYGPASHDTDSELAYDRNQGYVIDIPAPGIHFSKGMVIKVYDEDVASTPRDTSVTAIYQQAATGTSGGTIKCAYSEGNAAGTWTGETVIHRPCLLHSIHFFNNATREQGLRLYEGRDDTHEVVNFKAGDNSLHQIYFPKPGFIFTPSLFYKTDYHGSLPERVQVTFIYQDI